jgi:hypothetical protein
MKNRPDILIPLANIGSASPECGEALKDWQKAISEAEGKRKALEAVYRNTPEYAALTRLVGYAAAPSIGADGIRISGSSASYSGGILWEHKPDPYAGMLDPKTLNMLLSGKLLTDAEKRQLLARHGVTFDDPTPKAQP